MDSLLSYLSYHCLHLSLISSLFIFTWIKSIKGGFCIDDDTGIQQFSERWQIEIKKLRDGRVIAFDHPEWNKDGDVQVEHKVDSYKEGDKEYKFLEYQPHLGFPGAFMRWHRLNIGKSFKVLGKNKKGHEVYGYQQSPKRHHVWSLIIHFLNTILTYVFIASISTPTIAFSATALFIVHPVSAQCVAWISGVNYLYCLLFALSNFVLVQNTHNLHWTIPLTVFFSFASSMTLLPGCFNWVILLLLGRPWEAFASFLVSLIVFTRDGLGAVNFRKKNFKEQNMGKSTFFNLRKPIVILKTLWYYTVLIIFPEKLGLYHVFGYHYDERMERMDKKFLGGLFVLGVLVYFILTSPFIIKFSIIWMLVYWLIFSNVITANQFVVERYIFIPSLGFAIIVSYLLQGYPSLFWLIVGLYCSRTLGHLWTFLSQKDFYMSNWINFRDSEVALGNLGVVQINEGKHGSAIDTWQQAGQINPFYDVSWYNLYSIFRSHGMLGEAKTFLENCLKCKTIHFQDRWQKEYEELCNEMNKKPGQSQITFIR